MADFVVVTTTSTSLNFLIYVQNLYLSQKQRGQSRFPSYRVPYFVFHEQFEENFRQLWATILAEMNENPVNDLKFFYEQKDVLAAQLFNGQAVGSVKFEDVYQTFQNWWGSFVGSFAIERAADDKMSQLYTDLTMKYAVDFDQLTVSILYDDYVFASHETPYEMKITSIPEIYLRYEDVVARIVGDVIVEGE